MSRSPLPLTICIASIFAGAAQAQNLKVSPYFSDHMVLQRALPIKVWGTATPDSPIEASFSDQKATAKADTTGHWAVNFPAMTAGGPFQIQIHSGADSKTFTDVQVGDVWLIAGQSNVVFPLATSAEFAQYKAESLPPNMRYAKVPNQYAFDPQEEFGSSSHLAWVPLDAKHIGGVSGVGYHFMRTLEPVGVPMALVQASAGGTRIEEWMPEAALTAADPKNDAFTERAKAQAKRTADPNAHLSVLETGAATLYNSLINPLRGVKFAGVVWYQGEANAGRPSNYETLLRAHITAWRAAFDQSDLPFIIVQLPNFGDPRALSWAKIRESQMGATRLKNTFLAVTIDQGEKTTKHPPRKAEVGHRAGLAALQHVYGQPLDGTSPTPRSVKFEGDTATVEWDGFAGDLQLHGDTLTGFELAGADQKFAPATAQIAGRRVILRAPGVPSPRAVRYLWDNSPAAVTLFSVAGLPAAPFRSDAWPQSETSSWLSGQPRQ